MTDEQITEIQETKETQDAPEVSVEELQRQLGELQSQLGEKDAKVKSLEKTISKRQSYDDGIAKITERLDAYEESMAMLADQNESLLAQIRGEEPEQPKPPRTSHQDAVKQKRETQTAPKHDPDVMKFVTYVDAQGMAMDDSLVKEAAGGDRDPREALAYLKEKVKAKQDEDADKRASEKAKIQLEQMLKEHGFTSSGARGPSAPAENWRDLSPEEKIRLAVSK